MKGAQGVMYPLSRLALSKKIQNEEPFEEIGHARGSQLPKRMRAVIVVRFLLRIRGWDVPLGTHTRTKLLGNERFRPYHEAA